MEGQPGQGGERGAVAANLPLKGSLWSNSCRQKPGRSGNRSGSWGGMGYSGCGPRGEDGRIGDIFGNGLNMGCKGKISYCNS